MRQKIVDLRQMIFKDMTNIRVTALIRVENDGILAGTKETKKKARDMRLRIELFFDDGDRVKRGDVIARIRGNPQQIAFAEDSLIGLMSKTSGIATASKMAVELAGGKVKVVSGALKKVPPQTKDIIRNAISVGGSSTRISDQPFVYLDKNYVKIFGGIKKALEAVRNLGPRVRVIQLKGTTNDISLEAIEAVEAGADIIVVDTGVPNHIDFVSSTLEKVGIRNKVKLGFAGDIKIQDIPELVEKNVDILEIGRQIVDAPMIDMRLDVDTVESAKTMNPAKVSSGSFVD